MNLKTDPRSGKVVAHIKGSNGERRRISLGVTSIKEARALAEKANLEAIEHAARAKIINAAAIRTLTIGTYDFDAEVEAWSNGCLEVDDSPGTVYVNKSAVLRWAALADLKGSPSDITAEKLNAFINAKDDRSLSTRQRNLGAVRSFLRWLDDRGFELDARLWRVKARARLLPHTKIEPKKRRVFTAGEVDLLLAHAEPTFWRPAIAIASAAGLRLGDIAQLQWSQFGQELVVWTEKRDRRVCLPIEEATTPGLAATLATLPASGGIYVFPEWAAVATGDPKNRAKLSVYFGRICKACQIEGSFHCLRHTCITRWRAQGFDLEQCRAYAGHSSSKTTEIYTHVPTVRQRLVIERYRGRCCENME
jgi:integrase